MRKWAPSASVLRAVSSPSSAAQPVLLSLTAAVAIGGRVGAGGASVSDALLSACFGGLFAWLAIHDAATRIIPNRVLYPATLCALALAGAWDGRQPGELLAGGALAFAGFATLGWVARGGIGGGDLKMGLLVGLVVGYSNLALAAVVTVLSGGLAAIALLAAGRVTRSSSIAYAPFIALGGVVALLR